MEESQYFIFKHFPALIFSTCEEAQVQRFWSLKILGIKSKLFILQLKKNLKLSLYRLIEAELELQQRLIPWGNW